MQAHTALASPFNANMTVDLSLGSAPSNAAISMIDLGSASTTGLISSDTLGVGAGATAATISFSGGSALVRGSIPGVAAAPWSGSSAWAANYLAAQSVGGVTIAFAAQQRYFGLLWGSVDAGNTLDFYNGAIKVGTLTGADVLPGGTGWPYSNGSVYANVDMSASVSFDRVVASFGGPAFEFGSVAYSATAVSFSSIAAGSPSNLLASDTTTAVPAPGPSALLLGLVGLAASTWRRVRRQPA
jgi:MYXO-CTERM domain-containing protein